MWFALAGQAIFSRTQARIAVIAAIASHYTLAMLLFIAIRKSSWKEPKRVAE